MCTRLNRHILPFSLGVHATAKKNGRQRINVILPGPLSKQLDTYCVQIINRRGFINDVKPKVIRAALKAFLEDHAEDYDVKL